MISAPFHRYSVHDHRGYTIGFKVDGTKTYIPFANEKHQIYFKNSVVVLILVFHGDFVVVVVVMMTSITTEDLVLRLRQLLLEQSGQQPATVAVGSSSQWAAEMDGSNLLTAQPPSSDNSSISQAIFNVLQGLRPPPNTSRQVIT